MVFFYLEGFRPWFTGTACLCIGYYLGQTNIPNDLLQKTALWTATICLLINVIVSTRTIIKKDVNDKN